VSGITEKVFKVSGQRSRSLRLARSKCTFCGGGLHFDDVASRLTLFNYSLYCMFNCVTAFVANKDY